MKIIDKLLIALICIVMIALLLGIVLLAVGLLPQQYLSELLFSPSYKAIVIGAAVFCILLLLIVFFRLFASQKGATQKQPACLVKNTEYGMIQISNATIDELAKKAILSFQEVKDVRSMIVSSIDNVSIKARILVMPGCILPELTQAMQKKVKEYVETTAGISVTDVLIYVDNLYSAGKTKL